MEERPWAEHLKSPSKRGVGALSSVAAFKHERVCEVSTADMQGACGYVSKLYE